MAFLGVWVLALLGLAGSVHSHTTSDHKTEAGTAHIRVQDVPGQPSRRILTVQLDTGLVFLLDVDQDQLASVHSEQRVEVTWPLPLNHTDSELLDASADGAGGSSGSGYSTAAGLNAAEQQPFNATAAGVSCSTGFLSGNATLLNSTVLEQELDLPLSSEVAICPLPSDTDTEAKVEAGEGENFIKTGPAPPVQLPVYSFSSSQPAIRMLIIPIIAQTEDGNRCPGVQQFSYTIPELRNMLSGTPMAGGVNLADAYNSCSHGKTVIHPSSTVTDLVKLACKGRTRLGNWKINGCEDRDQESITLLADRIVRERFGINPDSFDSIIYLLPRTRQCTWAGLGTSGCMGAGCRLWVNGNYWQFPAMYLHEQGHQLSLGHAGAYASGRMDEYGDRSGAMGYCCELRCHNTPQAWQLGWLPVSQITGAELEPGSTITVQLLPQSSPEAKGVRIVPGWAQDTTPVFLGFRDRTGGDAQLGDEYAFKTNIYRAAIQNQKDYVNTLWLGAVDASVPVYSDPSTGLTIRHIEGSNYGATITVCRYAGPETWASCCKGLDNDCNGLLGENDAVCAQFDCSNNSTARRRPAVSPEPTDVSPRSVAGPAAPSVQSFMIRQHFYVMAPIEVSDCSDWLASTNKPAYVRAISALVRLQSVRLECQYSGIELNADIGALANDTSVAGAGFDGVVDEKQSEGSSSLLRVSILGLTGRMTLAEAKRTADGLNRAVVDGRFAQLVQQNGGSTDELLRPADGYCVVGYTPCPPKDV